MAAPDDDAATATGPGMIADLTILKKGLILVAIPLLVQLGFIGLLAGMRREAASAQGWAVHTQRVLATAWRPIALMAEAHAAMRGFVITGEPDQAVAYERAIRGARGAVERLRGLVADNPGQVERAGRIASGIDRLHAWQSETMRLAGGGDRDRAAAVARVRGREGQGLLDDLGAVLDAFLEEERRLDAVRQRRLTLSWRQFDRALLVGSALAVGSTSVLAILFGRGIAGRVAVLVENARRLGEGRPLAPRLGGSDEIARLDDAFHRMAAMLGEAARKERDAAELLRKRAADLDRANGELAEKQRENELFIYSVSHDLRSPLVNLLGFSKELDALSNDLRAILDGEGVAPDVRGRGRGLIDGEMAEATRFIQAAVTRMSRIIDALLRLARVGRVEYRPQSVDVASVVARVVEALRVTIAERGATVTVGRLEPAWGDPTALEQVFANLVGNAVAYLDPTRPGRVEVACDGEIGPEESRASRGLRIYYVKDNGLGIPGDYHAKVFNAFQRLHQGVAPGEGIGLASVRRMVDRHGGRIWFESEPGVGSTFYVALPAAGPGREEGRS